MKKTLTLGLLCLAAILPARAQLQETEYIPGDILVMLKPGADVNTIAHDLAKLDGNRTGLRVENEVSAPMRTSLLHFDTALQTQWNMLRAVWRHPAVQLAQNNHVVKERLVPNDTQYGQQWHHQNIDSEAAWDISTGGVTAFGDTIVVAIIENADLGHADLSANAWINALEIPGNGIDDDANGYIDDRRGWNTPNNNDNVYSGGHGTQCAGMVGATGNNATGVAGANWSVKMMPVNYGGTSEAAVVGAYTYPLVMRRLYNSTNGEKGAFVVATSASWGIDGGQPGNSPLWCAIFDTLGTAGVLNCGATANNAVNVDAVGDLPTACPSDFMISVTATNNADQRTFSAWGLTTIDVGAPGDNVRTTSIGGGYGNTSGTSFACPLTAGVIGLLYSAPCPSLMGLVHADPTEGALYVRQKLFEGVEQVGNLPGNTVTGGRISSGNSIQLIMAGCSACPAPFGGIAVRQGSDATYSWTATTSGPFNARYRELGAADWIDLPGLVQSTVTVNGIDACTGYEFQAELECDTMTSGYSNSTILPAPVEGAPTVASSVFPLICAGDPLTLTSSVTSNIAWSSGQQTASITPQQSGDYSVTFTGQCGTYTSTPITVTMIAAPIAPTSSDVLLAGPGSTTLNAVGTDVIWYDAATAGNVVGTGSSFVTPVLNTTTTFWCASSASNPVVSNYGGPADRTATGQYQNNGTNYLRFTANQAFMIRSVKVYANGAGVRPIALVNAAGNTVVQGSFNIPDGESRVTLDFIVPAAGTYGLRIANGNPQLWRDGNGSNPAYPFVLGSYGSITGTTATGNSTAYYYFFYDWEVSEPSITCTSARVPVVVTLPTGVGENNTVAVRLFPQPADRDLFVDVSGLQGAGLSLELVDATGREVISRPIQQGRVTIPVSHLADGLYGYRIMRRTDVVHSGRLVIEHGW